MMFKKVLSLLRDISKIEADDFLVVNYLRKVARKQKRGRNELPSDKIEKEY
jgi:hypothetical protein